MTYNDFIQNIINTRGQWSIPKNEYFEVHHILPQCMGGEPKNYNHNTIHNNLIWLYPKEHYIAHMLLAEENSNISSIVQAFWAMSNGHWYGYNSINISAEEYDAARKLISNIYSSKFSGSNNPMYGKPCYYNMQEDEIKSWKHNLLLADPRRRVYYWVEGNKYFESGREASRQLGLPWNLVQRSASKNITIKGYTFKKLNLRNIDEATGAIIE